MKYDYFFCYDCLAENGKTNSGRHFQHFDHLITRNDIIEFENFIEAKNGYKSVIVTNFQLVETIPEHKAEPEGINPCTL